MTRIAGVVLAAGRSTRMGSINKLLVDVDGRSMVRCVVEAAVEAGLDPVMVVLGHEADRVRAVLRGLPARYVVNDDYAQGIGTSIRTGIRALLTDGDASTRVDAAAILLADMPWLTASDLRPLVAAFAPEHGRAICAPIAGSRRGNPVLWAARYFPNLLALDGDTGARELLLEHRDVVCMVPIPSDGVVRDVDTPDELNAARSLANRTRGAVRAAVSVRTTAAAAEPGPEEDE